MLPIHSHEEGGGVDIRLTADVSGKNSREKRPFVGVATNQASHDKYRHTFPVLSGRSGSGR